MMMTVQSGRSQEGGRAAAAPGPPVELRCESSVNPLGIDAPRPRLSWLVNDARRGAVQSAYRILVAARPEELREGGELLWDSGRIQSDRSVHVAYDGPALASRQRCWWTVCTWDSDGHASPWAAPAFWEMGLLSPADWQAEWISAAIDEEPPEAVPMGGWIWHPAAREPGAAVVFRRVLEIRPDVRVERALICLAADQSFILFVNGRQIGHQIGTDVLAEYELDTLLRPGANVIAIRAEAGENACGLSVGARIHYEDETVEVFGSDDEWVCAQDPSGNWKASALDAESWPRAVIVASFGGPPWGRLDRRPAPPRSVCLQKAFRLDDEVVSARVYVTGLGVYELFVNGQRVGDEIFAPGWTKYDRRIQYQTHDVTSLLKRGENAVGAVLGSGWWAGGLGLGRGNVEHQERVSLRLLLRMEVRTAGGGTCIITSDPSWRAHLAPIIANSFYHGEIHDARLEMPGWSATAFDDADWAPTRVVEDLPGVLVAQKDPPVRPTAVLSPVQIAEPARGVFVFDFGQNHAGRCRLRTRGGRGSRIQLRFAERVNPDGTIYTDNLIGARNTDVYACRGEGEEHWEPRFTYRGFRYVELTGAEHRPELDDVRSEAIHSAPAMAGSFACSDELINRLHRNIVWSQRSNMHSVPTDCPQRDERLGWMGDAQIFAPTACWNMDMSRFFAKWMDDIADSAGEDGHVTDVAPRAVVSGPAAPGWGDAVIVIPWTLYRFYGDTRIVERHFDTMRGWVDYMRAQARGDLYEREGYGDWVAVEPSPTKPISAAYFYLSTVLLSRMAGAIGRDDEAGEYETLAARIRKAFNERYFDPSKGMYEGGTQAGNTIPLAFGLVADDHRDSVLRTLVRDIETHDNHLTTGFLGTGYVLPLLTAMGRHDLAWRIVTQRTYPSWGYMIEQGATTMWELWNGDTAGPHMNSHNHFALGSVGQWFYEALAGITIDDAQPGFQRFAIRPRPAEGLHWARAEHRSVHGLIRSAWRRTEENGRFELDVTVPANTSAQVWLPVGTGRKTRVRESGVVIDRDARSGSRPGAPTFLRQKEGCDVLEIGAGEYSFEVDR
ncbi:MAG: family 78 glycoside hydrolase catalytic domain [Planctomycetota bacterium]|nr:family 78 glycoside hydrolase catalytic domain [Planctomycetota bacterium]